MNHLEGLNTPQQEAVRAIDGPLLVAAGAGSGKTRVIAHRILEIMRGGVAPEEVLAITFTNKAAGEMRTRVLGLLHKYQGESSAGRRGVPFVSTFHSLGLTLIKENHKLLGYKRTPAIYDRADSLREMKRALKAVGADDIEPRAALGLASRQKGEGVTARQYAEAPKNPYERQIASAWLGYEAALKADGALDFDDLLLRAVELLEANPALRAQYQTRWRYLLIDEYQDTNHIQARLSELLVGPEQNICAVGDLDQCIYTWRGAQIENLLQFEKKYPNTKVVLLEENYRSTQKILEAANALIAHNRNRPEKTLFTKNPEGESLSLYIAGDAGDEALFVTRKIMRLVGEGAAPQDFAVLYRANFQSRAIEEKLLDAQVPYQVLGTRFFERKEVKDTLSYLRAALYGTPADIERAAKTPARGIGATTLLKMFLHKEISGALGAKVAAFRNLLQEIGSAAQTLPPAQLVTFVVKGSGMDKMYKDDKLEGAERLENLRELVSLAARYQTVEEFLEAAALQSEQDELKEEKNAVRLMTVHAAKGLEFPYVFIVGLEEGLFPYEGADDQERDREEERRLMYVALTRGEKKVFLSYAMMRTLFGKTDMRSHSSFLEELPAGLIENELPEQLGKTIYLE